jgi:hypothetical protein
MSMFELLVVMDISAAVLAPWIDYRFRRFAPDNLSAVFLHFLLAKASLAALVPAVDATAGRGGVGWSLVALFGFILPVFVYAWLTWFWALKLVFSTLRGRFN